MLFLFLKKYKKLYIEKSSQYFNRIFMDKIQVEDAILDSEEGIQENKIYMGGLPTYLKDPEIKKLCETFGKLKYFNLAKQQNENKEWVSKGYCFFEYEDKEVTDRAIKALNGLPCGDRKLKVSKVTRDQNKLAKTQQIQNDSGSYLGDCHLIKNEFVRKMLSIPEYTYQPSRVIQLLNMCSPEDLFEDDIYNEIYQDVQSECEKIGPIEKVEIVRPCKMTGICPPSVGKIFVKFKYLLKAKRARHVLNGRTYNKRTVVASFYPEEKFDCKEFLVNLT
ncbi:u2 snrnp auxilliary splicing factor, putative [Ichthyophthirius multifiliis]|uniref:U2 snrnp auxilliary splicing factor, putative n=1 Tax=Ichthyophthirius multifiliis TaxID=5932 RepID=G0QPW3_ICHMU|nr:u2 snrnp auxilliary splicing factor, putative [Ichthyophthirius multifiliis]EGR32741.1 u2 snrnp auxilliary splicing factor, putative [Ichthyophthirius multifiliis]|eukprot:XP_004036727.1 u2 snrnp auxilliary splicing factor, putative [Ichthyophthirius multifiliis]